MPAATKTEADAAKDEQEPQTPAARRAAGLPPKATEDEQATAEGGLAGAAEMGTEVPDGPGAPPRSVQRIPGGEDVTRDNVTAEELALLREFRSQRGAEIREKLASAPVALGTEADPYALMHLRGCPAPEQTETYDQARPDGRVVTTKRCMTCGAQTNIDH